MKHLLILFMTFISLLSFSQVQEEYTNMYENDTCKQSLLYSKSKMYIVDIFKSANNVIQNDDPAYGTIVCKGTVETMGYYFSFTLKIKVKDGASKITISDIYNSSAPYKYSKLNMNKYEGIWKNNVTKKQYSNIMSSVHRQLDGIVEDYDNFMMSEDGF